MTVKPHPYVKISGKYFALRQSITALAYYLYFKNRPLKDRLGLKPELNFVNLKKLLLIKLSAAKKVESVDLPVFGHICFPIHRGYKFFNFKKGTVVKLFDRHLSADAIAQEIEGAREAGRLIFAPAVVDENKDQGWFEEELVDGDIGYTIPDRDPGFFRAFFNQHILPIVEEMILFKEPVVSTVGERVDHCLAVIHSENRLSSPGLDADKVSQITSHIEIFARKLAKDRQQQIGLVFSHGDFSFKNIAMTAKGAMVIDWESVSLRSVTFDLYNWFITEHYYERVDSDMVPELQEAIAALQDRLNNLAPGSWSFSSHPSVYRNLYYLERLAMLIQRELNDKSLDVILKSCRVFTTHEENQRTHASVGHSGPVA